jgi:hypothetical protein
MSAPEIAHRLREQAKRAAWRSYRDGWSHFRLDDGPLPALPALAARLEAACARQPALRERIRTESRKILAGDLTLLGYTWPAGTLADLAVTDPDVFLRDPVSGQIWPNADAYCFDVPYRHATGTGDVKYIWELNRLQFLQAVAAEARLDNDRALACKILGVLVAWMERNPPFRGINWCSGIELAMRMATLVVLVSFLEPIEDAATRAALRTFLNAHVFWLARYPSLFSSANNHLVAEAMGLFLAGTLAPDLPCAARLASHGRAVLEREILKQIHPDGVGAEQSPTYTATTVEMFALARVVGGLKGASFSAQYDNRLAAAADFLCWMTDDFGRTPAIGDNDEGRVVALSADSEPRYVLSVAAAVGGLLGRADVIRADRAPELRDALFAVPAVPADSRPRSGMRVFEQGGYTVVRDESAGVPVFLVMDHGPLGYLSIAAHGHADALAIWLHVGGTAVFVDAGTYLYHAGGVWRDHFRSTAAHNTMLVNDESASTPSGAFNWQHKARARLLSCRMPPDWCIEAEHDGYAGRFGLTHRRQVKRSPTGFDIVDRLVGPGTKQRVSIRFLLAPDITASPREGGWSIALPGGGCVTLAGPESFDAQRARGDAETPAGWVSPGFGARRPAEQLSFDGWLSGEEAVTHVSIMPGGAR